MLAYKVALILMLHFSLFFSELSKGQVFLNAAMEKSPN